MNLALSESGLPVCLRFERPMTDEEFLRFCAANEPMRVERETNGEIVVMSPAGFGTGRINSRITRCLDEWAEADGRGVVTDSNGGYALPDGSVRAPDAAWVSSRRLESKMKPIPPPEAPPSIQKPQKSSPKASLTRSISVSV